MIDPGTIAWTALIAALASAAVQLVVVLPLSRSLQKRDREMTDMAERLSTVELNYVSRRECEKQHQALQPQLDNFLAGVIKLERVATQSERLINWLDDVTKEQISLGKDLSALASDVRNLRGTQHT